MKAFVLSAGFGKRLEPLTNELPKPMLPVLNKPLLEYVLQNLKNYGFDEVKINLHHLPEFIDSYFGDGKSLGLDIHYSLEKRVLGTAGALLRNPSFFKQTTLIHYGCCLADINLNELLAFHKQNNSHFTIAVKDSANFNHQSEICFKDIGLLNQQSIVNSEFKNSFLPIGIFLIEKELFELIPIKNKIDLIPEVIEFALNSQLNVFSYVCPGNVFLIENINDLFRTNQELLTGLTISSNKMVFAGQNSKIPKKLLLKLKSPLFVGNNVKLNKNIDLAGPIIIGNNVRIDKKVNLENAIILNNTFVGENLDIIDSILFKNLLFNIKTHYGIYLNDSLLLNNYKNLSIIKRFIKSLPRISDIIISAIALLVLSPVFFVIAVLIKIDSKGTVFYKSKRIKTPEKVSTNENWYKFQQQEEVVYYKFRTMVDGADQEEFISKEENLYKNGPFFKAKEDKRITKVGRILRKFSLDELPLLYNVLIGDLSLVGIWGLPTNEAANLIKDGLIDDKVDLSETASTRFKGKLGLAGYWQSSGRSELSADERAIHDSIQALDNIDDEVLSQNLGEYKKSSSFKGYYSVILKTINSVISKKGAI